jgi:hypothetical protein
MNPVAHEQLNHVAFPTQIPPFRQGDESQRLITFWQKWPVKPVVQVQLTLSTPSMQVAPFKQGEGAQSLMLLPQSVPLKPGGQVQLKDVSSTSVQIPPFWQGRLRHTPVPSQNSPFHKVLEGQRHKKGEDQQVAPEGQGLAWQ